MMLKKKISPAAAADIQRINNWYLEKASSAIASRFLAGLNKGIAAISLNPERYMFVADEIQRYIMPVSPFVIFFSLQGSSVVILRVRHKKQRPLKRY